MRPTTPDQVLVFSYGSNMSTERIRQRTPSAIAVTTGYVLGRTLKWHKPSTDGSSKCDMAPAAGSERIWGVVFTVNAAEKLALDRAEGLGTAYEEEAVQVHTSDGVIAVTAYVALRSCSGLQPWDWYKQYVLDGAREHGLPDDHIRMIEAIESAPDPRRPGL